MGNCSGKEPYLRGRFKTMSLKVKHLKLTLVTSLYSYCLLFSGSVSLNGSKNHHCPFLPIRTGQKWRLTTLFTHLHLQPMLSGNYHLPHIAKSYKDRYFNFKEIHFTKRAPNSILKGKYFSGNFLIGKENPPFEEIMQTCCCETQHFFKSCTQYLSREGIFPSGIKKDPFLNLYSASLHRNRKISKYNI